MKSTPQPSDHPTIDSTSRRNEANQISRRAWIAATAAASIAASGCPGPGPSIEPNGEQPEAPTPKLRLAVVDDEPLGLAIERQWKARATSPLEIIQLTSEEIRQRKTLSSDAVIYPSGLLGDLMQKQMVAAPGAEALNDHALDVGDLFSLPRIRESNWNREMVAVPLGSPVFTVMMRTDLVAAPPNDWTEYATLAAAAAKMKPQGSESFAGAAEPLAGTWAAEVLLARAATYARRRDTLATLFDLGTMTALLNSPPFERALSELAAIAQGAPESLEWTPADAAAAVRDGRCAMTLAWISPIDAAVENAQAVTAAELPGGRDVYDRRRKIWDRRPVENAGRVTLLGAAGRMGSVTRLSAHPNDAFRMLSLISSTDWSRRICPDSVAAAPFRKSQMASADKWLPNAESLARSQAEVIQTSLERSDWLFSPRLAGRDEYLTALAEAVHSAAKGESTPAESLQTAAGKWDAITKQRGVDEQQKSYEASLSR